MLLGRKTKARMINEKVPGVVLDSVKFETSEFTVRIS